MLACLICLLPLQAPDSFSLPAGDAIVFDGKVEEAEWAGAYTLTKPLGDAEIRVSIKRTGPWLAIGLAAGRAYEGELMRVAVAEAQGLWVSSVVCSIGQPIMPPGFWRRGPPKAILDPEFKPQAPRGVRARVLVGDSKKWSAEYMIRLSTLGIGHADRRAFRFFLTLTAPPGVKADPYVELPAGVKDDGSYESFAMLEAVGGWGDGETWAPVAPEASREFDDHELLARLAAENEKLGARLEEQDAVIAAVVAPRSEAKIRQLRARFEAGRKRNPTLPAWSYFLGRLLHESNYWAEARALIDGLPEPIARLAPFVSLAAKHLVDMGEHRKAFERCKGRIDVSGVRQMLIAADAVARAQAEEKKAVELDAQKSEPNPRFKITTAKGEIVCELFEDDAPGVVHNFIDLVEKQKFYDSLTFHSVMGAGAASTGDPRSRPGATTSEDHPGWRLRPDASRRRLLRGYIGVGADKDGLYHGSQFLIAVAPMLRDEKVMVFGRVLEGMEVVDRLEQGDRIQSVEIISKRNHVYDPLDSRVR